MTLVVATILALLALLAVSADGMVAQRMTGELGGDQFAQMLDSLAP